MTEIPPRDDLAILVDVGELDTQPAVPIPQPADAPSSCGIGFCTDEAASRVHAAPAGQGRSVLPDGPRLCRPYALPMHQAINLQPSEGGQKVADPEVVAGKRPGTVGVVPHSDTPINLVAHFNW